MIDLDIPIPAPAPRRPGGVRARLRVLRDAPRGASTLLEYSAGTLPSDALRRARINAHDVLGAGNYTARVEAPTSTFAGPAVRVWKTGEKS